MPSIYATPYPMPPLWPLPGTPVSSADRDTRSVFGDYIHVYDMQQTKEDGATVAIFTNHAWQIIA